MAVLRQICCDVLHQSCDGSLQHVSTHAFDACPVVVVAFKRTHQITVFGYCKFSSSRCAQGLMHASCVALMPSRPPNVGKMCILLVSCAKIHPKARAMPSRSLQGRALQTRYAHDALLRAHPHVSHVEQHRLQTTQRSAGHSLVFPKLVPLQLHKTSYTHLRMGHTLSPRHSASNSTMLTPSL